MLADAGVPWILMHWRRSQRTGRTAAPDYDDVVAEVRDELLRSVDAAVAAGVDPARLIIDPGLGFAKNAEHNWALLRALAGVGRDRAPGAGRRVAQAVPRRAAGRPRWHGAAAGQAGRRPPR